MNLSTNLRMRGRTIDSVAKVSVDITLVATSNGRSMLIKSSSREFLIIDDRISSNPLFCEAFCYIRRSLSSIGCGIAVSNGVPECHSGSERFSMLRLLY